MFEVRFCVQQLRQLLYSGFKHSKPGSLHSNVHGMRIYVLLCSSVDEPWQQEI
jgi:hypothetical protein